MQMIFLAQADSPQRITLWDLFWQSADLFTVLLVAGSVVGAAALIRCAMEVRQRRICPAEELAVFRDLIVRGRHLELLKECENSRSIAATGVAAALRQPASDRAAMRESAELAASERCATWFRLVEPLHLVGTLGPLLGLAGTVWGMIIAFAALGAAGGQAGPGELSVGISKALFHTLLGLLLAIPALAGYGVFRTRVDRLCNKGLLEAGELVERLPEDAAVRRGEAK